VVKLAYIGLTTSFRNDGWGSFHDCPIPKTFEVLDKHGLMVGNMDHRDNDILVQVLIYMRVMFIWEEDMAIVVMRVMFV